MKIFTDESGDFSLINYNRPSLITSLICTEDLYEGVKQFISTFEDRYGGGEEVKGSSLKYEQRLKVCQFVKKNRSDLKICLTIISPAMVSQKDLEEYRELQVETFERNKQWYINHGGTHLLSHYEKLMKISQYQTRMSDQEFLQAMMLVQQLRRVLTFCMVYFYKKKYRNFFKDFAFVYDRKLPNKLSGMEKYFKTYVMPFLDGQSKVGKDPIPVLDVWREGHPFIDRYIIDLADGKKGIHLNKVFGDNCFFMNSKNDPGLRLVDMISNTIFNYLVDPENEQNQDCYNLLRYAIGAEGKSPLYFITLRNKENYQYVEPQ
jgi:hypothetical protein